jgi:predicted glutamine amidotransferase
MDQQYIWVSRYYKGTSTDPLSLYYDNSNGMIVSSEPVTETFNVFPENNVFVFNHSGDIVDTINL